MKSLLKKSAASLALAMIIQPAFAKAAELRSVRMFKTQTQFSDAVSRGKIVVDFAKDIPLRPNGAGNASTYIEKTMTTENDDGTNRVLTMACSLHLQSSARKARISSTAHKTKKWQVTEISRVGHAEMLTLRKRGAPALEMMCYADEVDQSSGKKREISMTASMIDRVLSEHGGRVKTLSHPEELRFSREDFNDGLGQPGVVSDSAPAAQAEVQAPAAQTVHSPTVQ